jgi:hypothetical protein
MTTLSGPAGKDARRAFMGEWNFGTWNFLQNHPVGPVDER